VRALALLLAALAGAPAAAEPLRFQDLDGRAVELTPPGDGEAIVLHWWATWCPTCGPELRAIEDAARACAGSGVRVLAVDVGEPALRVRRYAAEHALGLPIALDPSGSSWRRAGGRELPANLVWTAKDRQVSFGPSDAAAWRARLAALGCGAAPDP
jgi:peroxiredoxin